MTCLNMFVQNLVGCVGLVGRQVSGTTGEWNDSEAVTVGRRSQFGTKAKSETPLAEGQ